MDYRKRRAEFVAVAILWVLPAIVWVLFALMLFFRGGKGPVQDLFFVPGVMGIPASLLWAFYLGMRSRTARGSRLETWRDGGFLFAASTLVVPFVAMLGW
ncbi:hypothetical protein [Haloferula sp. A504]|uniref:hypothetical protein n=1 Tax=Haloferula sp. A504 TaxID=3373601 RepID=UPI0031C81B11|nr:hypothetical protein [Verrucomicrobiaceae bacterium E54]